MVGLLEDLIDRGRTRAGGTPGWQGHGCRKAARAAGQRRQQAVRRADRRRPVSFELAENEVLGLIGPNGSGKTTMLNLISGALKPSAGQIRLYDDEISRMPANEIANTGIARTFQIVRMLPAMTVLENVVAGGVFGHSRRWGGELEDTPPACCGGSACGPAPTRRSQR